LLIHVINYWLWHDLCGTACRVCTACMLPGPALLSSAIATLCGHR